MRYAVLLLASALLLVLMTTSSGTTLQEMVDATEEGGTLYLENGTYSSPGYSTWLNRSITIEGTTNGTSVVTGDYVYTIEITGAYVTIRNLTITSSENGVAVRAWQGDNLTIENCIIEDVVSGISFDGNGTRLENLTIRCEYTGIMRKLANDVIIRNCTIEGATYAMEISGRSDSALIEGNTIRNASGFGIQIAHGTNVTLYRNTITGCEVGIYEDTFTGALPYGLSIEENLIEGNVLGVFVKDENLTLELNASYVKDPVSANVILMEWNATSKTMEPVDDTPDPPYIPPVDPNPDTEPNATGNGTRTSSSESVDYSPLVITGLIGATAVGVLFYRRKS